MCHTGIGACCGRTFFFELEGLDGVEELRQVDHDIVRVAALAEDVEQIHRRQEVETREGATLRLEVRGERLLAQGKALPVAGRCSGGGGGVGVRGTGQCSVGITPVVVAELSLEGRVTSEVGDCCVINGDSLVPSVTTFTFSS